MGPAFSSYRACGKSMVAREECRCPFRGLTPEGTKEAGEPELPRLSLSFSGPPLFARRALGYLVAAPSRRLTPTESCAQVRPFPYMARSAATG